MRTSYAIFALGALTAIVSSKASAQAADRKGFYADVGVNYTIPNNELTESGSSVKDTKGIVGFVLGAGSGINQQWRLGGQIDYWKTSNIFESDVGSGVDGTVMFYTVAVTYYPSLTSNFWLRANLGYGQDKLSGQGESASAGGFAGGLGLGWDWMVGKGGFCIAPYAAYMDLFSTGDFGGALSGEGISGKVSAFQIGATLGYKH